MHPSSLLVLRIHAILFKLAMCAVLEERSVYKTPFAPAAVNSPIQPLPTHQLFSEDPSHVNQLPRAPITGLSEEESSFPEEDSSFPEEESSFPEDESSSPSFESDQLKEPTIFTTPTVQAPSALITPPPNPPDKWTTPSDIPAPCTPSTQCIIMFPVSHLVMALAHRH